MSRTRFRLMMMSAVAATALNLGSADAQNLLLGFTHDKSGPWVSLTRLQPIAVEMAIEEVNAAGGVNGKMLAISTFDAAGKPDQAVVAVRRFAQDEKALAIVGPFSSSQCRVAFPAGEREAIVQMATASSAPGLTKGMEFAFRNTTDEAYLFERMLRTVKERGYSAKIGSTAYADDEVIAKTLGTIVFPEGMKKSGLNVVEGVSFKLNAFDLSAQVSQLKARNVDLLGVGAPPEATVVLANELARQGVKVRMYGGTPIADNMLPERMGKNGDGTLVSTTFFAFADAAKTKKFTEAFTRRARAIGAAGDTSPNQYDASAYDAVLLYAEAMRRAKVTGDPGKLAAERKAIRDELAKLRDFEVAAGVMGFDENRDGLKTAYVLEAKDGKWALAGAYPPGR